MENIDNNEQSFHQRYINQFDISQITCLDSLASFFDTVSKFDLHSRELLIQKLKKMPLSDNGINQMMQESINSGDRDTLEHIILDYPSYLYQSSDLKGLDLLLQSPLYYIEAIKLTSY